MAQNYTILSNAAIQKICALIRESHSITEGLNDNAIATNSTYSSAKITELLDSASIKIKEMYLSEYELLSEEEKNSDIIYFIINKNYIMYRNIVYGEDKNDYNVINNAPIYLNSESAVEVNSNYKTFFDTLGEKNYTLLGNKPQINNVELGGNKSSTDLGLASTGDIETIQTELDTNIGYSLGLSVDPLTYVMTVDLKNSTGEVISTQNVDLPIESMIISASYANKKLTLNLQSGETLDVDISDIIEGLVNEDFTIAGINMKDNITATELKTVLDIDDIESDIANLKATDETTATEIASVKSDVAINKTALGTECKNLFNIKTFEQAITYLGITYVSNDDKSVNFSGTCSGTYTLELGSIHLKSGNSYKIIGNGIAYSGLNGSSTVVDVGKSKTVNVTQDCDLRIFKWFGAGNEYNTTIYVMVRYADITDDTYEPYQPSLQEQITTNKNNIADVMTGVYLYNKSYYGTFTDGYVMRVGNQVHINCKIEVTKEISQWVSVVLLPFKVKSPNSDGSRYTITNTQSDNRTTSIYINDGSESFFSSTTFQVGDVIEIKGLILDMYVVDTATTQEA